MSINAYSTQNSAPAVHHGAVLEEAEKKNVVTSQEDAPRTPTIRRSPGSLDLRIQIIGLDHLNLQSPNNRQLSSHSSPSISRQANDGVSPLSTSSLTPKAHPGTPSITSEIDDDSPASEGNLIGNPFGQLSMSQISTVIPRSRSAPPEADLTSDREGLLSLSEVALEKVPSGTRSVS